MTATRVEWAGWVEEQDRLRKIFQERRKSAERRRKEERVVDDDEQKHLSKDGEVVG